MLLKLLVQQKIIWRNKKKSYRQTLLVGRKSSMYVVNLSSREPTLDRISDLISDLKTPFNCGGIFVG